MHVHAQGQRGIAAGEPARCHEDVVHGRDAEAAERFRDRSGEVPALLDVGEALEGEGGLAVVHRSARFDFVCE